GAAARFGASRREFIGRALGRPGPGHELVEARGGPEIDQLGEDVGEVGLRIDAVQFAGFDERSNAGPVLRAMIVTGEERILAIKYHRANASFDDVGVELDAAVIEEAGEPVPEVRNVSLLVAIGVNESGYREILGTCEGAKEDKTGWSAFLKHLKER